MAGNGAVFLTSDPKDQCARWDCRRRPARPLEYCSVTCQEMASSDSESTFPVLLPNGYKGFGSSSTAANSTMLATKILNLLKAGKEIGVPHLSQYVFQSLPWQSSMFSYTCSPREEFCQWLFIGPLEIPETSDFKWKGGVSKMVGEVSHCVLKPSPSEDDSWKLHKYSSPDLTGKAMYLMHCKNSSLEMEGEEEA